MARKRRKYTREFKLEALELMESSDKPIAQIERELGLSQGLLHHWRKQSAEDGDEAFPGQGRLKESDERIRQLERENEVLRQEREILKKAITVFAQELD
jgi:transposase